MNTAAADQFLAAQKANVETFFGLGQTAFQNVEKLVELNLQASKSVMTDVAESTQAALAVKSVQDLVALQQSLLQPAADKAMAYGRHVYEIAASSHAELVRVAEAQFADAQQKLAAVVDTAAKNAPAGSENMMAMVKSAMSATHQVVEQVQKASRQAATAAEAQLQSVARTVESVAKAAPVRSKRAA